MATTINAQLADRVNLALKRNPHASCRNLRFETSEGRVVLRGEVGTYYEKQMAQEAVRHVDGVDEIANKLQVRSNHSRPRRQKPSSRIGG